LLAFVSFAACSSDDPAGTDHPAAQGDASAPDSGCPSPESVPTFGDLERGILTICRRCHSEQVVGEARNGAPEIINFDTYEQVASAAEVASYMVQARIMPFPDGEGPTEEQRQALYQWTDCGKPR
jgi:uncharacterized membrane protein